MNNIEFVYLSKILDTWLYAT